MLIKSMKFLGVGLAAVLALGFATPQGHGEITVTSGKKPPKSAVGAKTKATTKGRVSLDTSNWVQCWQHGVKIIDEKGIFDIRLQKLIARDNLGFKGRDAKRGEVLVVPLNGDSTCLIKPINR
jgi:hypothetical protein